MKLPPNIRMGQLRRTVPIVSQEEWNQMAGSEQDAANAITFHIWKRTHTKRHPAFDGDETFLTNGYVQRLLKAVNATNTGEKAARQALATMQERGWIEDTGRTKKPRRFPTSIERAERYAGGDIQTEGGRYAQPMLQRSYWWRVFRVPVLTKVLASNPQGAYPTVKAVPHSLASLLAFLRRQGVISKPKRRSRPNPGSVQWVFLHSGPP